MPLPVIPVVVTAYTKPRLAEQSSLRRSGGVAGVTKPIPAGSLRHVDQNIETAYSHFYSLSLQREIAANTVASVEYTGSTGRKLYDLADPNKRGAALVYQGVGTANQRPLTQYGYGQLKPTGAVGSDTQAAITKFERDRKLPVTGQMSDRLVKELTAMIGHPID